MVNKRKLHKSELIGSQLEVIDSKNKSLIGIKGKIIDETKNMFVLDTGKKLIKSQIKIKIQKITLNGKKLAIRPEDRLKK